MAIADPETLLMLVIWAGLAFGLPVALRYLPAWYREWRALKFLEPAVKHFQLDRRPK